MARRRRRTARRRYPKLDRIFGVGVLVVIAIALARATYGLIFLPVVVGVPLWLVHRRRSAQRLQAWLRQASRSLATLRSLSPGDFERVMATALGEAGWTLRVVGGSGDEGADLIGHDPSGRSALVQCKRYTNGHSVGSPAVQLVIGARTIHHVDRALLVTTSRFTDPARRLAAQHAVELVDETTITQLAGPALTARNAPPPAAWDPPSWPPPEPGSQSP